MSLKMYASQPVITNCKNQSCVTLESSKHLQPLKTEKSPDLIIADFPHLLIPKHHRSGAFGRAWQRKAVTQAD